MKKKISFDGQENKLIEKIEVFGFWLSAVHALRHSAKIKWKREESVTSEFIELESIAGGVGHEKECWGKAGVTHVRSGLRYWSLIIDGLKTVILGVKIRKHLIKCYQDTTKTWFFHKFFIKQNYFHIFSSFQQKIKF